MFNWLKNLFCRPCEQSYSVVHLIYEFSFDEPQNGNLVVKPKRKYVKSGKYVGKNKKAKKGKK